jgi:hypothetical protein
MPLNGDYVCADGLEDGDIQAYVREHLESDERSYCGRKGEDGAEVAADVKDVIELSKESLRLNIRIPSSR